MQPINRTLIAAAVTTLLCGAAAPAMARDWPSGYSTCADQGETCKVGSATRQVSFGIKDKWVIKSLSGNIACRIGKWRIGASCSAAPRSAAITPLAARSGIKLTREAAAIRLASTPSTASETEDLIPRRTMPTTRRRSLSHKGEPL